MDKRKQQRMYWREFSPLWWGEIKTWFGWTDWTNAIFKIAMNLGGIFLVLFIFGNIETFLDAVFYEIGKIIIVFIFIDVILMVTYHRASKRLYENQANTIGGLESKLSDVENSKSVIRARNPLVQPKGFANNVLQNAISIDVLNISPGTTAEKVFPTVTWLTMRGKLVTENHGRWWISNEDMDVTKTIDRQVIDLLSNGMAYSFHFAIQSPSEQHFYAWYRERDGSYGRYPLHEKKYKVRIHFQSNNSTEAQYVYIVSNDDGKLSIREVKR